ncbi:MAG: hypothetical protein HZC43_10705 [Nitrosomonadales bacterium]|nr:hypothetical protein [Nitrosomonadales bacterium]
MKKILLAGFAVLLAVSGCGDNKQAADTPKATEAGKAAEPAKQPERAGHPPDQTQAGSKDAILARHMKCREEKGADCFKILEEINNNPVGAVKSPEQQQAEKQAHNDAVYAKHMKCRQDKGADCFKILDEMRK